MKAVTRRRARIGRTVLAAAMLPASMLFLAVGAGPAQASFPGANGLIAFVTDRDSVPGEPINDEVYVTDEAGRSRRLTNNPAWDTQPTVSPNGKEVLFASQRDYSQVPDLNARFDLYLMDASDDDGDGNGDSLRRLTHGAAVPTPPSLAWSPDGRKIAFTCLGAGTDICVMDAEGSEAPTNLTNSPGSDAQAVFSPDGTKIAFLSARDGDNNIYLMNADGSGQVRLTDSPATDSQPEFSPDGTRLAFTSTRDGNFDIYVMKPQPEGSANVPVNLTNSSAPFNDRFAAWSPDGTKIAFGNGTGNGLQPDAEIYLMNADGSHQTNLTNSPGGDITPDWGRAPTKKARPKPGFN